MREKNMTRKDYQMIADVIKASRFGHSLEALALNLSVELKKDNPRFKPALFLKACGL
jgi:hypothetical protein